MDDPRCSWEEHQFAGMGGWVRRPNLQAFPPRRHGIGHRETQVSLATCRLWCCPFSHTPPFVWPRTESRLLAVLVSPLGRGLASFLSLVRRYLAWWDFFLGWEKRPIWEVERKARGAFSFFKHLQPRSNLEACEEGLAGLGGRLPRAWRTERRGTTVRG